MEILLQHGWGFDNTVWQQWHFPFAHKHLVLNRGYFGHVHDETFTPTASHRVIITHSFGLHLLKLSEMPSIDLLVIIAGFRAFSQGNEKASGRIQQMIDDLSVDPQKVLQHFYQRCGCPDVLTLQSVNHSLLIHDLHTLKDHVLDVATIHNCCQRVLILHGKQDLVVSREKALELHTLIPNSFLHIYDDAGHALLLSHAEACMKAVTNAIEEEVFRPVKNTIKKNFSAHATQYTQHATMHRQAATTLCDFIGNTVPQSILEIGCGTGLVTDSLIRKFPQSTIDVTDISPTMVEECRKQMNSSQGTLPKVNFSIRDGEQCKNSPHYDLIISGLTFQWFLHLSQSLQDLIGLLRPGGSLIFSILLNTSFPEWQQACATLKIPYTGNSLPSLNSMQNLLTSIGKPYTLKASTIHQSYPSSLHFFRHMKKTGTSTPLKTIQLTTKDFCRLLAHLEQQHINSEGLFSTSFDVLCVKVKEFDKRAQESHDM